MKQKTGTVLFLAALCLLMLLPAAMAETRQSVIALEGMEETIEETLFESPQGFSFWYASDRLGAESSEIDGMNAVMVSALYSDDAMLLSLITKEEAEACLQEADAGAAENADAPRTQTELYRVLEDGQYRFSILIVENGRYLRADGQYAAEAAEGNAKFFQRVLDSVSFLPPIDYAGRYTNGSYDEVLIEKQDGAYTMAVSLYRLTSLDEGEVSLMDEGLSFRTVDSAGNPMVLSFYPAGEGRYTLRVEESTWEYLAPGTVYEDLMRAQDGGEAEP